MPYIAKADLLNIDIGLSKNCNTPNKVNIDYSVQYKYLLSELDKCKDHSLYLSGVTLIGAIAEGILNCCLLDSNLSRNEIEGESFSSKIKMLKILEKDDSIIDSFDKIRSSRNHIHINKLHKNKSLEDNFNQSNEMLKDIIKQFGI